MGKQTYTGWRVMHVCFLHAIREQTELLIEIKSHVNFIWGKQEHIWFRNANTPWARACVRAFVYVNICCCLYAFPYQNTVAWFAAALFPCSGFHVFIASLTLQRDPQTDISRVFKILNERWKSVTAYLLMFQLLFFFCGSSNKILVGH